MRKWSSKSASGGLAISLSGLVWSLCGWQTESEDWLMSTVVATDWLTALHSTHDLDACVLPNWISSSSFSNVCLGPGLPGAWCQHQLRPSDILSSSPACWPDQLRAASGCWWAAFQVYQYKNINRSTVHCSTVHFLNKSRTTLTHWSFRDYLISHRISTFYA